MVQYTHEAWGEPRSITTASSKYSTIANLNPLRYRRYYYDIESNLYSLMSRYYDTEIGQFISMDTSDYLDPETIGGVDLYAYCGNNPVMRIDSMGASWISISNRFTNDFFIGNEFDLTFGNPYSWFINNLLNAFKTIGDNVATFFVDTVWNNGIVSAWNWLFFIKLGQIVWNLSGVIVSAAGLGVSIAGLFAPPLL